MTPYEHWQLTTYGNILPETPRVFEDVRTDAERMEQYINDQYELLFINEENN